MKRKSWDDEQNKKRQRALVFLRFFFINFPVGRNFPAVIQNGSPRKIVGHFPSFPVILSDGNKTVSFKTPKPEVRKYVNVKPWFHFHLIFFFLYNFPSPVFLSLLYSITEYKLYKKERLNTNKKVHISHKKKNISFPRQWIRHQIIFFFFLDSL